MEMEMEFNMEPDLCDLEPVPVITERDLIEQGYKYLGWMSGWDKEPPEMEACYEAGHELTNIALNESRTLNIYKCDKCKIFYKLDSSD